MTSTSLRTNCNALTFVAYVCWVMLTGSVCVLSDEPAERAAAGAAPASRMTMREQLAATRLPDVQLREVNLLDVIQFLGSQSVRGRTGKRGVNFLVASGRSEWPKITLRLRDASLDDILQSIARQAGLALRVDEHCAVLTGPDRIRDQAAEPVPDDFEGVNIPEINFHDAELRDVLQFFADESARSDPSRHGVKFLLRTPKTELRRMTCILHDLPVTEAVRYAAEVTGLHCWFERGTVLVGEPQVPPPLALRLPAGFREARVAELNVRAANLADVLNYLIRETANAHPQKQALKVTLRVGGTDPHRVTLSLGDTLLSDALRYVAWIANVQCQVEGDTVVLSEVK